MTEGKQTQVSCIDRLPRENSYEALGLLRAAWDRVDVYNFLAKQNKRFTIISFLVLSDTLRARDTCKQSRPNVTDFDKQFFQSLPVSQI